MEGGGLLGQLLRTEEEGTAPITQRGTEGQRAKGHLSLRQQDKDHTCPGPFPADPDPTYNVICQVSGGPDEEEADERGEEGEPGQGGDLGDALAQRLGHARKTILNHHPKRGPTPLPLPLPSLSTGHPVSPPARPLGFGPAIALYTSWDTCPSMSCSPSQARPPGHSLQEAPPAPRLFPPRSLSLSFPPCNPVPPSHPSGLSSRRTPDQPGLECGSAFHHWSPPCDLMAEGVRATVTG